ncbi:putative groEL-like equatorial domain superfamily [Helianthus anomalus]
MLDMDLRVEIPNGKNLIRNNSIVHGGGAAEISCSIAVEAAADKYSGVEQGICRCFGFCSHGSC